MIDRLDHLHAQARANPLLYRVTLATRCLFAMAFLPTGMVKLLGERFTQISPESPIGAFFEAMYQTGGYWRFLGATQMLAGLLMLIPRTATLAAVIFFPLLLNIFVITVALGFHGTPYLTGAMLVGATSLLAWDWDRLRGILTPRPRTPQAADSRRVTELGPRWERAAYAVGTAAGLALFGFTRGFVPRSAAPLLLGVGAVAALVALAGAVRAGRLSRRPG